MCLWEHGMRRFTAGHDGLVESDAAAAAPSAWLLQCMQQQQRQQVQKQQQERGMAPLSAAADVGGVPCNIIMFVPGRLVRARLPCLFASVCMRCSSAVCMGHVAAEAYMQGSPDMHV